MRYPNTAGRLLSPNFVRKLGEEIGRHPTTDDVVWRLRDGRLGAYGTGRPVTPAPHLR